MDSPAAPEHRYSLDELATLAGLPLRTVRYYIQIGLVPRPEGERRGAYYLPRHLDQLLQVRRWVDAGLSLERIAELVAGAPGDPPPRPVRPGQVEVWSRVTLADGLEVHLEPGRAGLTAEQARLLVQQVTLAYRRVRQGLPAHAADAAPTDAQGEPQ